LLNAAAPVVHHGPTGPNARPDQVPGLFSRARRVPPRARGSSRLGKGPAPRRASWPSGRVRRPIGTPRCRPTQQPADSPGDVIADRPRASVVPAANLPRVSVVPAADPKLPDQREFRHQAGTPQPARTRNQPSLRHQSRLPNQPNPRHQRGLANQPGLPTRPLARPGRREGPPPRGGQEPAPVARHDPSPSSPLGLSRHPMPGHDLGHGHHLGLSRRPTLGHDLGATTSSPATIRSPSRTPGSAKVLHSAVTPSPRPSGPADQAKPANAPGPAPAYRKRRAFSAHPPTSPLPDQMREFWKEAVRARCATRIRPIPTSPRKPPSACRGPPAVDTIVEDGADVDHVGT
jgi:hypothetical protein